MTAALSPPPRFAVAAAAFLYDTDLPDHLYRTYARIAGLAWQQQPGAAGPYARTPPLTSHELAALFHMSERNVRRQIGALVERGLLRCETVQASPRRVVFSPVWPGSAAEAASPAAETPAEGTTPPAPETPGPAADPPAETGQALAEFGVDLRGPVARQVAALPHVTPALVRAWGEDLRRRPDTHNLPGLLLHVLQHNHRPPPLRAPSPPLSPSPAPSPPQADPENEPAAGPDGLPADLRRALHDLGWTGREAWAEVAALAAAGGRNLDFVWAWVRYVQARPALGAGFLRAQLRGTDLPPRHCDPEARRRSHDRARWQARWQQEAGPDPPSRRRTSPRREAMARYGLAPATMDAWTRALDELALQMDRATFDARLRGSLLLSVEDGRATLGVPAACSVDWLRHRLNRVVRLALNRHLDPPVEELHFVVLDGVEGRDDP